MKKKVHQCTHKSSQNIQHFIEYNGELNIWELVTRYCADAGEVEQGSADYIGELMGYAAMKIFFCPFCGMRLEE
ncbi:hypothetical protein LJC24_00405 [Desulfococcaceae bacterium OttesenSCG-928-F15]|nr:hypothetical protein [Desulfococcaceae bacterium OttesenSCG-928-F15]